MPYDPMPRSEDGCPCGSGAPFGSCCFPFLEGEPAPTALALMRSRYTAFVLGDEDHLFRSWHPKTRPAPPFSDQTITWEGLRILALAQGGADDEEGVVEFEAYFQDHQGRAGSLRERSRFARRAGRWFYVDGEIG
ncbi:YchJ family protein [Schaalia hyovaginalis]|uniref:YchJ family protein n=1 Tax=Schaalia hyovaginalis TaxID=29316 RepID=UPI0026F37858|nr:YchJ family metal-binding protein [Schaalia hyovaginalis]MDD7554477.1 YchJ family metal-binding protein [Schaalia hyovaginalis]MDY3094451.1 YchJ family metal-binding protein [Schaalia hyovaginalis]